jgi:hypothetical protein
MARRELILGGSDVVIQVTAESSVQAGKMQQQSAWEEQTSLSEKDDNELLQAEKHSTSENDDMPPRKFIEEAA